MPDSFGIGSGPFFFPPGAGPPPAPAPGGRGSGGTSFSPPGTGGMLGAPGGKGGGGGGLPSGAHQMVAHQNALAQATPQRHHELAKANTEAMKAAHTVLKQHMAERAHHMKLQAMRPGPRTGKEPPWSSWESGRSGGGSGSSGGWGGSGMGVSGGGPMVNGGPGNGGAAGGPGDSAGTPGNSAGSGWGDHPASPLYRGITGGPDWARGSVWGDMRAVQGSGYVPAWNVDQFNAATNPGPYYAGGDWGIGEPGSTFYPNIDTSGGA